MPKLAHYPDLEQAYRLFRTQVHNPQSVLYPCCATDATPSHAFDNVTYVDLDKESITILQQAKLNAHNQDIRTYRPTQPHDFLILLNPGINPAWATQHLQRAGYIIANNWHNTATQLFHQPQQYQLYGTIDYQKSPVKISTDLTDLFHPIKDAQELQQCRPEDYEFLKKTITHFIQQGILPAHKNDPFITQLEAFCHAMDKEIPSRRVGDLYIFKKK